MKYRNKLPSYCHSNFSLAFTAYAVIVTLQHHTIRTQGPYQRLEAQSATSLQHHTIIKEAHLKLNNDKIQIEEAKLAQNSMVGTTEVQ